jgi:hypothetical protein
LTPQSFGIKFIYPVDNFIVKHFHSVTFRHSVTRRRVLYQFIIRKTTHHGKIALGIASCHLDGLNDVFNASA